VKDSGPEPAPELAPRGAGKGVGVHGVLLSSIFVMKAVLGIIMLERIAQISA
jgi:hypothetical protein